MTHANLHIIISLTVVLSIRRWAFGIFIAVKAHPSKTLPLFKCSSATPECLKINLFQRFWGGDWWISSLLVTRNNADGKIGQCCDKDVQRHVRAAAPSAAASVGCSAYRDSISSPYFSNTMCRRSFSVGPANKQNCSQFDFSFTWFLCPEEFIFWLWVENARLITFLFLQNIRTANWLLGCLYRFTIC